MQICMISVPFRIIRFLQFAALLAFVGWQTGCATTRKQAAVPVSRPAVPPPESANRSFPSLAAPVEAARKSVPQSPPPTEQPHVKDTPSASLRKLLPKTCVVMEATATTLLVKSGAPTASPSLFEEAIALSKLRGFLSARPEIPKDTAQRTKLQNGTATIPFGKSVSPADAAAAVVAALSVDGVQRVRAELNAN